MSLQSFRAIFAEHAPDIEVIEMNESTTTIDQAARIHNVEPGHIARTLSLQIKRQIVLIVMRGDSRLDNQKLKQPFGVKAHMLSVDEVINATDHPIGGVILLAWKTRYRFFVIPPYRIFRRCLPRRERPAVQSVLHHSGWLS